MSTQQYQYPMNNSYVRTPEDDEQDRREAAWKQKMIQDQMAAFLRRNPSGRVIPKVN